MSETPAPEAAKKFDMNFMCRVCIVVLLGLNLEGELAQFL